MAIATPDRDALAVNGRCEIAVFATRQRRTADALPPIRPLLVLVLSGESDSHLFVPEAIPAILSVGRSRGDRCYRMADALPPA